MKKSLLLILLSSILGLGAMSAFADHEMCKDRGAMFKEADTNGDGKISYDEFKAQHEKHMQEMFKTLDANGDGFIDEAERKAGHDKMREKMKDHRAACHKSMDTNQAPAK